MSDGITDADREGTLRIEKWRRDQITAYLSTVSAAELLNELIKRNVINSQLYAHKGNINTFLFTGFYDIEVKE